MIALFKRELSLSFRSGGGASTALLFYLAVVIAMPFAIGPDPILLAQVGAATLWIGALLASLLGLERLFQADREDGSLDLFLINDHPVAALVFIKALVHWLVTGLPVSLLAPVFGLLLNLSGEASLALVATLLVGTPALSMIGAAGAALTVSLPRGGLLLSVLVLPLSIPVLIFGVGAVRAALVDPDPFLPPFAMLVAMTLFFAVIGPLAAAYALKMGTR
ncbi:MAG: heme exporter protein CcmB [Pseudomonadota bacterium]